MNKFIVIEGGDGAGQGNASETIGGKVKQRN